MVKIMIALLTLAFVGLFFLQTPSGKRILSVEDLKPSLPDLDTNLLNRPTISSANSSETKNASTRIYKWQDKDGIWQFSNKPVDAKNGEVIELNGEINIIPALTNAPAQKQLSTHRVQPSAGFPGGVTSASPEQVAEMMDTVNDLQKTVDERKANLDKLTGQGN